MTSRPDRRARAPDVADVVDRDGVRIAYEVFGTGGTTVLLMPTWSIVPSRFWKAQVGYLARHHRVVTFDGRGSGRSDRPVDAAAYAHEEYAADAAAVLDATSTEQAVVVSLSRGATWAIHLAAKHPHRVLGILALSPACGFLDQGPARGAVPWHEPNEDTHGWAKYNKHYWLDGGYDDFVEFFFGQMFVEAHSTKQIEDCVAWAHETDPLTLAAVTAAESGLDGAAWEPIEPLCAQISCPVLVVHGHEDRIRPSSEAERLAELTGGSLVLLDGVGHGPMSRHPVRVNALIRDFVDEVRPALVRAEGAVSTGAAVSMVAAPPAQRKRLLYLSSPIGLGHAKRDLAIVAELRRLHPDLVVDWLTQHPVTTVLEAAGEHVHPASRWLLNESTHFEHQAGEHDLHAFQAIRRMDEILVNNFMVFAEIVENERYDLVVGDESWDVDYFLHENPGLKRFAFAWLTDFVGWLPMPDGGEAEARLTADYNAEMIEHRARLAGVRDRSIFIGHPEDVVPHEFGPGLPRIRDWMAENFDFAGYVTGFEAAEVADREALRQRLGYRPDRRHCLVTVGGSGVGGALLRRVLDAVPIARRSVPELELLVVSGPRIDPQSLPARTGVTARGHVPDLYRHLAATDVAVVQGGLTTTMELTANQRPFVYVPLRNHFEQNFHVRHRLDRYGAGRCLDYAEAVEPDALAAAMVEELGREVSYRPVVGGGAARAARLLAGLL